MEKKTDLIFFAQKVCEQFLEDDPDAIEVSANFRMLDSWDSLTGMAVLSVISDDFGVTIPVEDFRRLNTIEELFEYVNSK